MDEARLAMSAAGEHAVGHVLNDRYELIEKVGEGGMAVTYRAKDRLLDREVAVKCMREQFAADPEFAQRFRQEARAAANLSHLHIAGVYDTGSVNGCHYLVMEFIEGENLKQRLRRGGPLGEPEALDIARQVAEALDAAHARGIVHRDIKPQNILINHGGEVKVTDFGIARAMYAPGDTDTGVIIGSAHYFAPEQARGEAAGPPADVYGLGCVLFEMLTGRPPFEGENPVAVAHMQIYDPPQRPRTFNPNISPAVERVIMKCLEKDSTRRYASARELAGDLANAAAEPTAEVVRPPSVAAAPSPVREAAPGPARANWAWAIVFIVLLAVGAVGAWVWQNQRQEGKPEMVMVPNLVEMPRESAADLLRSSALGLEYEEAGKDYDDNVPQGYVVRQDPRPGTRLEKGRPVRVWLSKGPLATEIPSLSERSVAVARRELEAKGFRVGEIIEVYDPNVPVHYVVDTMPSAGSKWPPGATVDLKVSKGPEPKKTLRPEDLTPIPETFSYMIPNDIGKDKVKVRIEMDDASGEGQFLYEGVHAPGETIRGVTFERRGRATVRVYIDGEKVKEKVYEGEPTSTGTAAGAEP
jgi:tRNA A-37 threonylcarbamoyl transferase component Bud32